MRARWSAKSRLFAGVLASTILTAILPISASANIRYAETNNVVWSEDFSDGGAGWGLANGFDITADGKLHYAATNGVTSNGQAAFDVSSLYSQLNGKNFSLRFKVKVKNDASYISSNMALDGTRIPQTDHFMGASSTVAEDFRMTSGEWYERCYVYTGTTKVDIYQRKLTEDTWSIVKENVSTTSFGGSSVNGTSYQKTIYLGGVTNATARNGEFEAWMDDFVIHVGDAVILNETIISGNNVTVGGNFCFGTPKDSGNQALAILGVVYDETTGVTKFADIEEYTDMKSGIAEDKNATFALPSLGDKDKTAYLFWDSLEYGMPKAPVMGYVVPNLAGTTVAPEPGQSVGITDTVSFNQVNLRGYVGTATVVTASLVDSNGKLCAVLQTEPNAQGMVDVNLAVDAETNQSGSYTLRVNYGGESNITKEVALTCADAIQNNIVDMESYIAFVNAHGSEAEKETVTNSNAAQRCYEYYVELQGDGFADINAFRAAFQESLKAQAYLDAVNEAVDSSDWETIQELVTGSAKSYFGVPDTIFAGIANVQDAILRMTGGYEDKVQVLADLKAAVASQRADEFTESKVVWTESFDNNGSGWTLERGFDVTSDGVLHYKATGEYTTNGSASYNVGGFLDQLSGNVFALRFKVKVKNNASFLSSNIAFDGTRIPQGIHVMGGSDNIDASIRIEDATWYERCYVYQDTNKVNIYQRKLTENSWTLIAADVTTQSFSGGTVVAFGGATSANARNNEFEAWIDDLVVHIGDAVILEEPVISGNTASVTGSFCLGLPPDTGDRTTAVIVAIYDTTTENTTFADMVYYDAIPSGIVSEKTAVFTLPGLSSTEKTAVMVWDSLEGGIPVSAVSGYTVPNKASVIARPEDGEGVLEECNYNQVRISGYVGKTTYITASLTDDQGNLCAVLQSQPTERGMIDVALNLDPEKYNSGTYTLRANYGNGNVVEKDINLICADAPYQSINDAESYKNFILSYGNDADKEFVQEFGVAEAGYDYLNILAGADGITDFNEFREILNESMNAKIMLDEINEAVASKNWSAINQMVTGDAQTYLQVRGDVFDGLKNRKEAILRMSGNYTDNEAVLADLQLCIAAQKKAEGGSVAVTPGNQGAAGGSGYGGSAGGGFGGGAGVGDVFAESSQHVQPQPITPYEEKVSTLSDLDSVPWAKEQIKALQELGIVNGEGDGKFYPDRTISREEFLKMAIKAAGMDTSVNCDMPFVDVEKDAWYYDVVAVAYQGGIINGISDVEFGIGQSITRADMAVIMKRILDHAGCEVKPTIAAYVFDDFWEIPEYASNDIAVLCEAQLMNGTGNNRFEPLASATRAEAAVLVYRINQYIKEER